MFLLCVDIKRSIACVINFLANLTMFLILFGMYVRVGGNFFIIKSALKARVSVTVQVCSVYKFVAMECN